MNVKRLFVAFVFGLGLTLALLWTLDSGTRVARADTLCVNPGGSGGCYGSIQAAVDGANDGDVIQVVQGVYYETVVLTKSVTLEGGWNADFSERDWDVYVTTVDAQRCGPVIRVNDPASPTIEGFIITGGDSSSPLGWGGGIWVYGDLLEDGGTTIIRHNVITNNIACDGSCQGYGGGIMVYASTALIEHNTIISNAARTNSQGGNGGGVSIWSAEATLISNTIISNTAVYSTTGFGEGKGGGVDTQYATEATLIDNVIQGNVAAVKGIGRGGGVYAKATLYDNHIFSNTASVSGDGYGGGVYAYYVTDLDNNWIQGNVASQNGDGTGGGIYAIYLKKAQYNTILDNKATRGGGVYMSEYTGNEVLRYNLIAHNQATGIDIGDGGGGIASAADWVEITDNDILSNTVRLGLYNSAGGGVLVTAGDQYLLQDNRIENNTATVGGGIAVYTATGTIAHNQVISNLAVLGGGMYLQYQASPVMNGNIVMSNTAMGFWGAAGGGVMVNVDAGTALTLTNHVIARNAAGSGGPGGGVLCWQGDCVLINNTIVDNDRGDHKEGVILAGGGSHTLLNNIIVGHSVGISLTSGAVTLDYNDYYDNDTAVGGATWGTHHRTDDPQFDDQAAGDYHLSLTSPLVDQGDGSVNVPADFEGDPRPRGGGIDIGADEAYRAESYVSAGTGDDATGDGSSGNPFATVTKGISETQTGGAVYVGRGRYTERITVARSVNLLGGYRETDWSRDITAYAATLDAEGTGRVVVVQGEGTQATVEGFTITGGEANSNGGSGGGVLVDWGAGATIRYNTITGNHAQNGGAGLTVWGDGIARNVMDSNYIYGNTAEGVFVFSPLSTQSPLAPQQGPEPGGGLLLMGGPAQVVNNIIYSNTNPAGGDGMALSGQNGPVEVYHNTAADNGDSDSVGIALIGSAVEISLYNNLIVGHGTGITGSTQVVWDYNGFYDNVAPYAPGLSGGAHDVSGDPRFADRTGGDYHIGPGSAGAGWGTDAGVNSDIDGNSRPAPAGTAPDMGAYEVSQRRVYLPVVLRNS